MSNKKDFDDVDFLSILGKEMLRREAEFKGIYLINQQNYGRFQKVCEFVNEFIDENEGKLIHYEVDPRTVHGGIVFEVPIVHLYKSYLKEFVDILGLVDVVGITAGNFGSVRFDFSVNYIWNRVNLV